jgi:diguanylate cyclase
MARIGGEEFVIILPETDAKQAKPCIEKLRKIIESKILSVNQQSIKVTMSFGIAEMGPEESIADLMERADQALYKAKNKGRNQIQSAD